MADDRQAAYDRHVQRVLQVRAWNERMIEQTRVPESERTNVAVYHRTSLEAAEQILRSGFRDSTGIYCCGEIEATGVFVSDIPLDTGQGAKSNDVLLRIYLPSEEEIAEYEWVNEGSPYREWCVPAELLNGSGRIEVTLDPEEE